MNQQGPGIHKVVLRALESGAAGVGAGQSSTDAYQAFTAAHATSPAFGPLAKMGV